jgi:hypothetical protein
MRRKPTIVIKQGLAEFDDEVIEEWWAQYCLCFGPDAFYGKAVPGEYEFYERMAKALGVSRWVARQLLKPFAGLLPDSYGHEPTSCQTKTLRPTR